MRKKVALCHRNYLLVICDVIRTTSEATGVINRESASMELPVGLVYAEGVTTKEENILQRYLDEMGILPGKGSTTTKV